MRILIVEDERRLAAAVKWGLESHAYVVDVVHNGQDALWAVDEHDYAAIILDVMLPGLNGYQVCTGIRAAGNRTPILMLTAMDGEYDEAEGLDCGADDYLTKPFSYLVLLARLRALVRRGGGGAPAMQLGDLVVDPGPRAVRRGEQPIGVTAREYAVLDLLARRRDQVVTKTEILHHVWDDHYDGDVNIVEVYVSALRKKIDHPFGRRSIQTVRGMGYRLDGRGG